MFRGSLIQKGEISETSPSGYDGMLLGATHDGASEDCSINSFQPLHTLSDWFEPGATTKCLNVAVLLPSGVGPGELSVRVVNGGFELHVTVTWPNHLADFHMLHRKWLTSMGHDKIEIHHPKFIGFEVF